MDLWSATPLVLVFLVAAGCTALFVPFVERLCWRHGWLAHPGPRSTHRRPTPTVGGLAMLAGLLVALLVSLLLGQFQVDFQRSPYELLRLGLLLIGATIIAVVSFVDDLRDLPAGFRLIIHFGAALVAVGPYLWDQTLYLDVSGQATEARGIILTAFNFPFVEQIHLHNLSPWLAVGATLFWIVGIQNMLNWVDGLDGLAAGVTLIAGLVLAMHALRLGQWTVALLPLALAGVCAGFLPFNFHPARIFMGDVGAMTLGYVLAVSAIIGGAKLATALLVLAVPITDMIWLIISRLVRKGSAAISGRDHLHLRLIDMGWTQRQVVAFYYTLSVLFGAVALLDVVTPMMKLLMLMVLGLFITALLGYVSYRQYRTVEADQ